jgi:hypothetical protein
LSPLRVVAPTSCGPHELWPPRVVGRSRNRLGAEIHLARLPNQLAITERAAVSKKLVY